MDNRVRKTLLILQEECAEVTQAVSKCFRFGLDNFKPGKPATNNSISKVIVSLLVILPAYGLLLNHLQRKLAQDTK